MNIARALKSSHINKPSTYDLFLEKIGALSNLSDILTRYSIILSF